MKIKLNKPWSRAKTDKEGRIIGWEDFKAGDVVEVSKKELKYFLEGEYELIGKKKTEAEGE